MNMPRAKKSLGQHFLKNSAMCRRIVDLIEPQPDDFIIEIGPGAGALTVFLESSPHSELFLLEKDEYWAKKRAETARTILIDALTFNWQKLNQIENLKIIGNLPYNVASPLIWDIISQCQTLKKAVFMVQKEVASRIVAKPGNKSYGALSVWLQSYCAPVKEFNISPAAFNPPPKVDSTVLSFQLLDTRPDHPQELKKILDICFQQRRKQLGTIFKRAQLPMMEEALKILQINPMLRPEDLTPAPFQNLSTFLAKTQGQLKG